MTKSDDKNSDQLSQKEKKAAARAERLRIKRKT